VRVRLFLAINIDPAVRRAVLEATEPLRAAAPTLSWLDDSRLHLTLKFVGEQPEDAVARLSASVSEVAGRHRRFSIRLADIGAFPNFRRARVVWMGVESEPRLELLHHDVEVACQEIGFELEGRAFRPHLTLARVKERTGVDELRQLSRASKRIVFEEETGVESIDVMRSNPTSAGARYERLYAAPLRSS
jgi:2'-5' RNA ligase